MTLLPRLAATVDGLHPGRRVLVAIDGPDAAGKTTLAHRVAERVQRPTVIASIDGWHNPAEVRRRRGDESPEGYFLDSFDLDALVTRLLQPFRDGAATVQTACYDHRNERAVATETVAAADAALLFDGVFLLRRGLRPRWDLAIYLHVSEAVTVARALERDLALFGTGDDVRRRYERRYLPGQALYRDAAAPLDHADIAIDNTDPLQPDVLRWSSDLPATEWS